MLDYTILKVELAYEKYFCKTYENEAFIRYNDPELEDMYYHNFTYLKNEESELGLVSRIEAEIAIRLQNEKKFALILANFSIDPSTIAKLSRTPSVSRNGYYVFDPTCLPRFKEVPGCDIRRMNHQAMVEDLLAIDLEIDEASAGRDFCIRRNERNSKVYLSNIGPDAYLCYHNQEAVGSCCLLIEDGVAKIESFGVKASQQHKGYGTTILKFLISLALKKQCHTIYLVADEEDTPKEMYKKLGFTKVAERTDLYFTIE